MAPLPKRRHSTRRGGKRNAAIKQKLPTLGKCSNCGNFGIPHRVCENCGFYSGKELIHRKIKKSKGQK